MKKIFFQQKGERTVKSVKYIMVCCAALIFTTTAFAQDSEAEDLFKFERSIAYVLGILATYWMFERIVGFV